MKPRTLRVLIIGCLFFIATTFVIEPYDETASIEWYAERILFSLNMGVTLLGLLLASITFVSGNRSLRNDKFYRNFIGPLFSVPTILLSIALVFGYIVIRSPRLEESTIARVYSSICIAFVNVSTLLIAVLILAFCLMPIAGRSEE